MVNKIVLDMDVETTDPEAVVKHFYDWYGNPNAGHQTEDGVDFAIVAIMVTDEGPVDG